MRRDQHLLGWQALGVGAFVLPFGIPVPPLLIVTLLAWMATVWLWIEAAVGRFPAERRCPACRHWWKAKDDHKHARPIRGA